MEIITAQNTIRKYFLDNGYDYLLFTSDDTEIPYTGPSQIMNDVITKGYDIITGWSLCRPDKPEVNISLNPPHGIDGRLNRPVYYHEYNFMKKTYVDSLVSHGNIVIPIWFTGYSLTAMSRKVVEQWTPKGWYFQPIMNFRPVVYKGSGGSWASTDLWFSYQMWKLGIPKYADLSVYVPHKPLNYSHKYSSILVGKEPADVEFRPATKPLT